MHFLCHVTSAKAEGILKWFFNYFLNFVITRGLFLEAKSQIRGSFPSNSGYYSWSVTAARSVWEKCFPRAILMHSSKKVGCGGFGSWEQKGERTIFRYTRFAVIESLYGLQWSDCGMSYVIEIRIRKTCVNIRFVPPFAWSSSTLVGDHSHEWVLTIPLWSSKSVVKVFGPVRCAE